MLDDSSDDECTSIKSFAVAMTLFKEIPMFLVKIGEEQRAED